MTSLIEFVGKDICPCCDKRSIECFDTFNNPINYSYLLSEYEKDKNVLTRLNKKNLSHFQCRECKKIFEIYWDKDREIPIPLNRHISNLFLDKFLGVYNK